MIEKFKNYCDKRLAEFKPVPVRPKDMGDAQWSVSKDILIAEKVSEFKNSIATQATALIENLNTPKHLQAQDAISVVNRYAYLLKEYYEGNQ